MNVLLQKHLSYLGNILCGDWQEVDFVCQALGSLHCGNVGVDEHSLDILLFQGFDGLQLKHVSVSTT